MPRNSEMIAPRRPTAGLTLLTLVVIALTLVALSCAKMVSIEKGPTAPPRRALPRAELMSKLERLNESHKSIRTFAMSLVMSISRQSGLPSSKIFRCDAVCEVPDKLRMKGYAGGTVLAFDLVAKSRKVQVFLPTRNELIDGTKSRFKDLPLVQKHGIGPLLEAELAHLFVPKLPEKDVFWESASEGVWLYTADPDDGSWQRTLLDCETFLPVRREIFSSSGELLIEIRFSDYRLVEEAYCPFELDLTSKTDGMEVKIVIGSMNPNVALASGAFSMHVPEGVTKIPPDEIETTIQEPVNSP